MWSNRRFSIAATLLCLSTVAATPIAATPIAATPIAATTTTGETVAGASGSSATPAVPADLVLQQLRRITLSGDRIKVAGFRLQAGLASVHLLEGELYPTTAVAGRPVELVFLGRGRFELATGDPVEQAQLELFTGGRELSEQFDRAVFVVMLDQAVDAAIGLGSEPADSAARRRAEAVLEAWHRSPGRRVLDVDARILADALGDPLAGGFFCGAIDGSRLGSFLYTVDPYADEQISLGQMVKPELDRRERRRFRSQLSHAQRQGKLIGIELSDLGRWVTWVSCSLTGGDGRPVPGSHGLVARHFAHDLTISRGEPELRGSTVLTAQVVVPGLRAAILTLHPDIEPVAVRDGDGRPLPYLRSYGELTVVLAEPTVIDRQLQLVVDYQSRPFDLEDSRRYSLRQPLSWHPQVTDIDRATFTATVRWPAGLDLLGNGSVVDSGQGKGGERWQQRRLDLPCTGFSFELGAFEVLQQTSDHLRLTVAVDSRGRKISEDLERDILATVTDSLAFFEQLFGPYPLDELVVVTSPRVYSQGLLGFITLSTSSLGELGEWGALLGMQDRRTVIAHEVAHQWWGNMVGWRSYRDQWISEAMANYAALLYSRTRLQRPGQDKVWRGPTADWTSWLLSTTSGGRPVESLGPVVLGTRLKAAFSRRAYEAIVYKKGAIVLDTLARLFGPERFLEVLRKVVQQASFTTISTDDLLGLVEADTGVDLDWFARQYIFGTGLPEVFYTYQTEQEETGGWVVTGVCRQHSPYVNTYRVVQLADGRLDVRRQATRLLDLRDSALVVPFQLGFTVPEASGAGSGAGDNAAGDKAAGDNATGDDAAGDDAADPAAAHEDAGAGVRAQVISGQLLIRGIESTFSIPSPGRPEVLLLDRRREVFARFFCETCWPRQTMLSHGLDLEAAGQYTEAEAKLREALAAPLVAMPERWRDPNDELQWRSRTLDVQIRLRLAQLYLDTDRADAAARELAQARSLMTRGDRWQFEQYLAAIETRLALAGNEPAAQTFQRIDEALRERRYARSGETYALLAIAALRAGRSAALATALDQAEQQRVDMTVLRQTMVQASGQ